MTWLADIQQTRPSIAKTEKLLAKRVDLVKQVEVLGRVVSFRTESAKRFHMEDLTALAKQIGAIDRQLGRG